MCWMCGCADHIGLGNERQDDDFGNKPESDIIVK